MLDRLDDFLLWVWERFFYAERPIAREKERGPPGK